MVFSFQSKWHFERLKIEEANVVIVTSCNEEQNLLRFFHNIFSAADVTHTLVALAEAIRSSWRLTLLQVSNVLHVVLRAHFTSAFVEEQLIFTLLLVLAEQLLLLYLLLIKRTVAVVSLMQLDALQIIYLVAVEAHNQLGVDRLVLALIERQSVIVLLVGQ